MSFANIIPLTDEIANLSIDKRRQSNIKLPDAVIAATTLHNNLILVTRNDKDFTAIKGLEIYNPFSEQI
ncbi:MAG: PIN domain-containing protein [Euryarchaeota archaeon]|nr:PIN domain-containing protein [Euryarchaeota archaeon]